MGSRYLQGMHFPGINTSRPHEKEFELFSNTKINVAKVRTEKEDQKMESGLRTSLGFFLTLFDNYAR